jgi:DNA modification methylase
MSSMVCLNGCGARRIDKQLGSEKTWQEYVANMVEVFREVKRVLRKDGTLWLNMGDIYGGYSENCGDEVPVWNYSSNFGDKRGRNTGVQGDFETGLPKGNLCGIPWRLAFALQEDGWILRQEIVWIKRSPMRESVQNRCTKAHEHIFLFAQTASDYYYDIEAVKVPSKTGHFKLGSKLDDSRHDHNSAGVAKPTSTSNILSWWDLPAGGYSGMHMATFPASLPRRCILAGTSEYGACSKCGTPWVRVTEKRKVYRERPNDTKRKPAGYDKPIGRYADVPGQPPNSARRSMEVGNTIANTTAAPEVVTLGWKPGCVCKDPSTGDAYEVRPCIVLDVFVGSGTTVAVAVELGRWGWGTDLSETYLRDNAIPRIEGSLLAVPALHHLLPRKDVERVTVMRGEEAAVEGDEPENEVDDEGNVVSYE